MHKRESERVVHGTMNTASPTVASLFSGCGGFDLGFESEGFRSVAAFDIDPVAVDFYNKNVASVAKLADLASCTPPILADVLIAGSPCQGFSTAGKRDLADPRNDLLVRAGEIALASRPQVFVLENVPAAIAGPHGTRWEQVEAMLTSAGYSVRRVVAEGPTSGVAQLRKRLFMIAWRGSSETRVEMEDVLAPALSSRLANIDDLQGHDPVLLPNGSRERKIAGHIKQGQKLCNVRVSEAAVATWDIPEVFGTVDSSETQVLQAIVRLRRRERRRSFGDADPVLPSTICDHLHRCCEQDLASLLAKGYLRKVEEYVDLRHTYNGKFRRLSLNSPSPTVDTHFGNPQLFLHPRENRGLTPREAARIQGFTDEFVLPTNRTQAFRLIGNAVPPPMGAKLARFVRDALLKRSAA